MKKLSFVTLFFILIFTRCTSNDRETLEKCYFEGQRDALKGDIRISKTVDGCWVWTKSCWDNGRYPTFNPSIICDGNK